MGGGCCAGAMLRYCARMFDNLAHDVIRFGLEDLTPTKRLCRSTRRGDMHELYEPLSDPLIRRYLSLIGPSLSPLQTSWTKFLPDRVRGVQRNTRPSSRTFPHPCSYPPTRCG